MKKFIMGAAVAAFIVLGVLVTPAIANAHTGDMAVTAQCNTSTGEYDFTVKLTTANTQLAGQTKWRVGTASFQGTPTNANGMDRGPVSSQGAQTITLGGFSLPGTTTGKGNWVYAYTSWTDGYGKGSDGQLLSNLAGDCAKPAPPADPGDKISYTDWVDEAWGCGDIETVQTREKQVVTHVWDEDAWAWVAQEPVKTTETRVRALTGDEIQAWQTADPDVPCFDRPTQPDPRPVTESRTLDPVCADPWGDGTATIETQQRHGETRLVWDETLGAYVDGETVWVTDWETSDSTTITGEGSCLDDQFWERPKPVTAEPAEELAVTGSPWGFSLGMVGIGLVAAGILIAITARHRKP